MILIALLALLAMAAASCSSASDEIVDDTAEQQTVTFRFLIYSGKVGASRADWDTPSIDMAEVLLNPSDMRVHLFDNEGSWVCSVNPSTLDYKGNSSVTGDGYYTLGVSLYGGRISQYLSQFDDPESEIPFRIIILANIKGAGGDYRNYGTENTIKDVTDYFTLRPDFFPTGTTGIPMYGYKAFSVKKSQLSLTSEFVPATTIDMIRALCKVEVAPKVVNSVDGYPQVTAVEITKWIQDCNIRPASDTYSDRLDSANETDVQAGDDKTGRQVDGCFRFYIPEADPDKVELKLSAILAEGQEPTTYTLRFKDYLKSDLIRNHIYRFDIRSFNDLADLTVNVNDWNVVTEDFDISNTVTMDQDGYLTWIGLDQANFTVSTETYNGKSEKQLSIVNGTNDYAHGRFKIDAPLGATWKAYFIPGENGVDAFEFVDPATGAARVFAEGKVGETGDIYIRGKGPADSYRHWAELIVEVHTIDGSILYAPLTKEQSSRYIIYRENRI